MGLRSNLSNNPKPVQAGFPLEVKMAAYLELTDKATGEVYAHGRLIDLDKEICDHLGLPCDPQVWVLSWMNTVGYALAMGATWEHIRKYIPEPDELLPDGRDPCLSLVDYLENRFVNTSFHSR